MTATMTVSEPAAVSASQSRLSFFILLRALPAWLQLARAERQRIAEQAMGSALALASAAQPVSLRHFDAEAFSGVCSDIVLCEASDMFQWHCVMESLRDSPVFSAPYFELLHIIPALEDGYRQFEAVQGNG